MLFSILLKRLNLSQNYDTMFVLWVNTFSKILLLKSMSHMPITRMNVQSTLITEHNRIQFDSSYWLSLLWYHWKCAWCYCVNESLAQGMHASSLAVSKWLPLTPLGPHLCGSVLWMTWSVLLIPFTVYHEHLYYVAVQNLVYRWKNGNLTSVANIEAPPRCTGIPLKDHPASWRAIIFKHL